MKVDKMSISVEAGLGDEIREAAHRAGTGISSWLADAALTKLRAEALAKFLSEWEAEHGTLTADEIARAEEELQVGQAKAS